MYREEIIMIINSNPFLTQRIELFPPFLIKNYKQTAENQHTLLRIQCQTDISSDLLFRVLRVLHEQHAFLTTATFKILENNQAWICIVDPNIEEPTILNLDHMIDFILQSREEN